MICLSLKLWSLLIYFLFFEIADNANSSHFSILLLGGKRSKSLETRSLFGLTMQSAKTHFYYKIDLLFFQHKKTIMKKIVPTVTRARGQIKTSRRGRR